MAKVSELGKKVFSEIASIAALAPISLARNAARVATRWEHRTIVWDLENQPPVEFYEETLQLYTKLGFSLIAKGRGPLKAAPIKIRTSPHSYTVRWATLKEVAEDLIGRKLPDIRPADAIELSKSSPFSAEAWWRGCTDRRKWDYTSTS